MSEQKNNPLHGITLLAILEYLLKYYGWEELANKININCFKANPSVKSSLTFLRKTPWARDKVESLYKEFSLRNFGFSQSCDQRANRKPCKPNTKIRRQARKRARRAIRVVSFGRPSL